MLRDEQTSLVVNRAQYVLVPELAVQLGALLQVGTRLQLTGTPMADGTIVVSKVVILTTSPQESEGHDD